MRKKLTLSIDANVYENLKDLPEGVSISEVISWVLKAMLQDVKKGRELNQEEFDKWIESTPEGKDFRRRMRDQWGPEFQKIMAILQSSNKYDKEKKHPRLNK